MITFRARYHDGRTSASQEVTVDVSGSGIVRIRASTFDRQLSRREIRVSPRLGKSPRYLHLPDDARCETTDHDAVEAAFGGGGLAHALERRWTLVAVAVLFSGVFLWLGFAHGVPYLAGHVAQAVPPEMELGMGEQALVALDHHLLQATRLTDTQQAAARAAFERVAASLETVLPLRLELRHSESLGANALALPSGIIVLTDAMVRLTDNEQQLMAVIAHEAGHVHHRHVVRSILQNSVTAVLIAALLGDVTAVTGLAASIPTFLVEQRYSRQFELEADGFALAWMREQRLDPAQLAAILQRLADHAGEGDEGFERYLSTHPPTRERIDAIQR